MRGSDGKMFGHISEELILKGDKASRAKLRKKGCFICELRKSPN
jgi:TfoX/Sxy family transcriptional regulator of competence genes